MNIITISREFGSGGRELGKRMADKLGYDYYDREIITAIARQRGLNEDYVEHTLEKRGWQTMPLTYGRSFAGINQGQQIRTELLVAQKEVIEEIAKTGRDCVIVGQNADVLLRVHQPFCIFVCAGIKAKILRCRKRAEKGEELSDKEVVNHIRRIDKNRARTRELLGGGRWGHRGEYHLTVNTEEWEMEELAEAVAQFALSWFERRQE